MNQFTYLIPPFFPVDTVMAVETEAKTRIQM